MPHLQFELDFKPSAKEKNAFAAAVVDHFARIMDTTTDHIAITFRCYGRGDLVFGRAAAAGERVAFLNADIRNGRTPRQKRELALAIMAELERTWAVPQRSAYIVFTEHDGENFHLDDRVLPSWSAGEDPLAPAP